MKKLDRLKLFSLALILMGALVFVGIDSLEAKKPGPQYTWQVAIPGFDSGYNLFGYFPQSQVGDNHIYEDKGEGDGIYVKVEKKGGGKAAESQFDLAVFNNRGEYGCATPWQDEHGDRKIGFQGITAELLKIEKTAAEEYPCFFPKNIPYDCDNPEIYLDSVPHCMEYFLDFEKGLYLHPYCDPYCGHPYCNYDYVEIRITVNCDIESITSTEPTTGSIWIDVVNTYDLQSGCEFPHNISGHCHFEESDESITITRINEDIWEIIVDGDFTFAEIYKGKLKGKRWEWKIPYWAQIPLQFKTTWIKNPS